MSQNYGALRIVRVRPSADVVPNKHDRYPSGWLPEERLVHLLKKEENTIGRALSNDIILMEPTVSREHARLVRTEHGWLIFNLTAQNVVRVNGHAVAGGDCLVLQSQDFLVLGNTMLQLIAPQEHIVEEGTPTLPGFPSLSPRPGSSPSPQVFHNSSLPEKSGQNGHEKSFSKLFNPTRSGQLNTADQGRDEQKFATPPALHVVHPLTEQADGDQLPQAWDEEEESLLGAGVTMQFALPQRMGTRTRWLIVGAGISILVVSAIITIILNSIIGISALAQNGLSSIVAALTIPLIPALVINMLVSFIDRYEREPWFLRLAAFLWGAVIAIPPALFIEKGVINLMQPVWGQNDLLFAIFKGLNAGITEESVKGLGLLLLFMVLRDEFDNVTDGIVYGALIGAGFAMVENFVYFALYSREYLAFLIVGRVVLGWLSHSTFTICFGAALGYMRHTRVRWRQILIPLVGYLVAVGLHSVFDFVDFYANAIVFNDPTLITISLIAIICNYIPPFIAQIGLLYILIKSLAHEAAVIREFLAFEVSNGVVRVDEYALLQNSFQRTKEERRVLWQSGWKQWMRVRALYQTEIGLAFRKWHVSMGDKPKLGYLQPEDAYRQRIKRLRYDIQASQLQKAGRPTF
ncbi:MAG: PrsW family intramembrane metalloprotease [Ktedonobacteraceae bacterium]|nr:PrsW family intramembrane metalloprotease [Ktedonobacteraceae bacterium]